MGAPGRNAALEILEPSRCAAWRQSTSSSSAAGTTGWRRPRCSRGGPEDARARAAPECRRRGDHRRDPSGLQDLHSRACRTSGAGPGQRAPSRGAWPRADRSGSVSVCSAARRSQPRARARSWRPARQASAAFRPPMRGAIRTSRARSSASAAFVVARPGEPRRRKSSTRRQAISGRCSRWGAASEALGKKDAYRLLRWAPMSAADFVSEWFESEPLRAAIAAGGIFGTALGPRSAGSTAVLLLRMATGDGTPASRPGRPRSVHFGAGRRGACGGRGDSRRMPASSASTCAIGRAVGVTLATGENARGPKVVVSNADPRRTMLGLVDPVELDPGYLARIRSYRVRRACAEAQPGAERAARTSPPRLATSARSAGFIHIGPDLDYLERAFDASKYGSWSPQPHLDITIPSLTDPALAPAGAHVMSISAQFAPYRLRGVRLEHCRPRRLPTRSSTRLPNTRRTSEVSFCSGR